MKVIHKDKLKKLLDKIKFEEDLIYADDLERIIKIFADDAYINGSHTGYEIVKKGREIDW